MSGLDWAVMALYGATVLAIGWWANRRQRDSEDYFLGGRRLRWWIFNQSPDMRKRSGRQTSEAFRKIASRKSQEYLWFLPWLELPRGVFEDETEAVHYWLKNPHTDPWKLDEGC